MAMVATQLSNSEAMDIPPQDVLSALSTSPHAFLQPSNALHSAALIAAKRFLDPLASDINISQARRRQETRRKRKRFDYDGEEDQILQLNQIYTDGFDVEQIWEQAKRVLDAAQNEVARGLAEVQALKGIDCQVSADDGVAQAASGQAKEVHFEEGEDEDDVLNDDEGFSIDGEEDLEDLDGLEEPTDDLEDDEVGEDNLDDEDIEMEEEELEEDLEKEPETYKPDPHGLNDGFFSIDDFNRQSQFLEQQDEQGDPDDGAASDEEEIDWDADPLGVGSNTSAKPRDADLNEDDEDDASEEEGPTFGNADLNALSNDDADEDDAEALDGDVGLENTNDIMYTDFFDPPPQKPSKTKRMRALPKTQPPKAVARPEDLENDIQRAVSDVRRDLFDDEPSGEESDDEAAGANANLSTHEKQRAKLMAEIRRLEAAAVTKRDWTLSGEARAVDRPVNSILEEDLEFERAGKPVPVITNEVSEEIEQLIKRRILAREFDEVIRRRPEMSGGQTVRRGRVEIDDTRPQQGLADMYETEHLQANDPNYVDKRDEKLKKEHAELARMWKDISDKLDLLSNWNYKPKIPEANVTVVTDAPTISMEDARPSMAAGMGGALQSTMAPQEVYAPGRDGERAKGEVMLKGGNTISKEEMSREEKLRRRRREKERNKKQGQNRRAVEASTATAATSTATGGRPAKKCKKDESKNILDDLRRGGVKVIGKKGEVTNVDGKKDKPSGLVSSASAFKL